MKIKRKTKILSVLVVCITLITGLSAYAKNPTAKLIATDDNGNEIVIEVFESDVNELQADFVIYKNSDPANKIYGSGTDLRRGFYYVNTDNPLFDIKFKNGDYKTAQPFKNIFFLYYSDGNLFISPKETNDPGWRIPYVVDKTKVSTVDPLLTLYDFITPDYHPKSSSMIFQDLKSKGFITSDSLSDEIVNFEKGNIAISYYHEEMDGSDCFNIEFKSKEAATKFVESVMKDNRWKPQKNYHGEVIGYKRGKVTISTTELSAGGVGVFLMP